MSEAIPESVGEGEGEEFTRSIVTKIRLKGASVEVIAGPDRGTSFKMESPTMIVGKGFDADMRLSDEGVSRRHLQISSTPQGLVLRDLGSRNGTFVGGCRVTEGTVVDDVTLHVGETTLMVRLIDKGLDLQLSPNNRFDSAIGNSFAMRHVFGLLERVVGSSTTVLFEGESGTGKEILAHAVHARSPRAEGPFVVVDCASIPENLIESELFGHERGAFTGAIASRAGAFESADGGTVFLDELGELPLAQQAKLLRALENREVRRVGGNKPIPLNVRVIAATNVRLDDAVRRGKFREDLYYRLAVVRVMVPPLRDRKEDIPALAQHFLTRLRGESSELPTELVRVLLAHSWPGNVRELRNVVERWATFENARPEVLFGQSFSRASQHEDAPGAAGIGDLAVLPYHEAKRRALEAFDRAYFPEVLRRVNGVIAKAAELAQVPRPSFHRMLSRARGNQDK